MTKSDQTRSVELCRGSFCTTVCTESGDATGTQRFSASSQQVEASETMFGHRGPKTFRSQGRTPSN
eukprot:15470330-Alexandrium_andersonii.AAC.1